MIAPSGNPITTPYGQVPGYPLNNGFHTGIDFSYSPDHTVYAPEAGNPKTVPWDGVNVNGNAIELVVGNRRHYLCHLAKFLIGSGQHVEQGQAIGIMGDTGYTQGAHLHWALRVDGVLTDPLPYIGGKGGATIQTMITDSPSDIAGLRIGHSEIGGWDVAKTHAGEYDQQFLAAWKGKAWPDFLYAQWVAGVAFRDRRMKALEAYPLLEAQLADLTAKLREAVKAPSTATAQEALQLAITCQSQLADAQAEKQHDIDTGNKFLRWIGSLFNRS